MILEMENNSEKNMIENNLSGVKRRRNRLNKSEKYQNERIVFISELESKMGLTEQTRGILIYDLEKNEELKRYLEENIELIKRIFKHSNWNYFRNEDADILGLLKSLFKSQNYQLSSKRKLMVLNNVKKQYNYIFFIKNIHMLDNHK
jgi:hypothetical protein